MTKKGWVEFFFSRYRGLVVYLNYTILSITEKARGIKVSLSYFVKYLGYVVDIWQFAWKLTKNKKTIGLLLQNNQGYSSPCSPFPSSNKNCSNYSGYGHYKYKSCSFLHSEISQRTRYPLDSTCFKNWIPALKAGTCPKHMRKFGKIGS